MTNSRSASSSISDAAMGLSNSLDLLRLYYEGGQLPSPPGGFLMVLRVQPENDGSGSVILECTASSLRYRLDVPKATRTERKRVRDEMGEGAEPKCPRHVDQFLIRMRNDLLCPKCGVKYAKA
ncbi:uncharacterized protein METZ01_LOCUS361319 [marine metagenome]|uniref:Uncharacterized protein n=1 Tax=marine metagenome TaxID=408172 RepID=A0A382SG80_9ZZZZ